MENNEIEILVNDYCDLRHEQELLRHNLGVFKNGACDIGVKECINDIYEVEYKLYQIVYKSNNKLINIDSIYDYYTRQSHKKIPKNKTIKGILTEEYIKKENYDKVKKIILESLIIIPLDIRKNILIKYYEDDDYEDDYIDNSYCDDYTFEFGKYKNISSKIVMENNINYINWFIRNVNIPYISRKQLFKLLDENN